MEGLCSWRQAAKDEAYRDGVLTPVLSARAAKRLRPDSTLWFSIQPFPRRSIGLMPTVAGDIHFRIGSVVASRRKPFDLALPTLRRGYGSEAEAHRRRTLAVQLLRFVITTQPVVINGRAHSMPSCRCALAPPNASPADLIAYSRLNMGSAPSHWEQQISHHRFGRQAYHPVYQYQNGIHSP